METATGLTTIGIVIASGLNLANNDRIPKAIKDLCSGEIQSRKEL